MANTFLDAIYNSRTRSLEKIAVIHKNKGRWQKIGWAENFQNISNVAGGFKSNNLEKGDTIAILSNTNYKWALSDLGALIAGLTSVPIYASNTPEDIAYILNNSDAKFLIVESKEHLQRFIEVKDQCPKVENIVIMAGDSETSSDALDWHEFIEQGKKWIEANESFIEDSVSNSKPSDLATIVYTSGTTGKPKGVMLTHEQIWSEITEVFALLSISDKDTSLTFLPFAHILGRVELWAHPFTGFTMGFAESIERIRPNLQEIKPSFLVAVPRIFEKVYNGVISQAEASPVKSKLFHWALKVGGEVSQKTLKKQRVPLTTIAQYQVAKKLVFSKLKEKLGGRLRVAFSGGAPLSKEIGEFFHAADLLILEGYGLTETTAGITANTPYDYRFGTVGKPIGEAQVKIADDGEILVKSKKVMTGYYKNQSATDEVLKDGWFYTGDIGEFTKDNFLRITDRKKDLIKTAGGKYIAPQRVENLLKLNKYVSNVLVHGDRKKYIIALIAPNLEELESFAKDNNISYSSTKVLVDNPEVKSIFRDAVSEANNELASFESIKNFYILDHDFTIESGELTPSMKVRRKFCDSKYQSIIENLYGKDSSTL